jgi:3D-(3,5/4)-trihydroxycyclohexane-1,2-dione acylhydrolase (decyclizing)
MTVSQAIVEFLANQYTVDGDIRVRTIEGVFGIFGHGNVAGIGQALKQLSVENPGKMPYFQARNEQAMGHESIAHSRMTRRRSTFACTASVGPGATNMLTSAAVATTNRLPLLLLPSDTFANRVADPVLQQLELPQDPSMSVNDAFKPLSRYFDRIQRPEQLYSAMLGAMRVLTDPNETGASRGHRCS